MPFYDKGDVRIHYEEVGAGFPLLVIPGGGLNSTVAGLATHPFNPFDEFKDEFRVIAADLRNAKGGQSTGPLEVDRPWDAYTDDQLGLMDHLGIQEFMVLGFCIGGPFIWNLLQRAGDRVVAAVPAQPSGYRPEMPDLSYTNNMQGWGPELCARRPDITMAMVETFLTNMYRARADFVYTVTREFVRDLPDADPGPAGRRAGAPVRRRDGDRASGAERAGEPVPVEGHQGQDPAGGAPHPHLPPGASTGNGHPLSQMVWRRRAAPHHAHHRPPMLLELGDDLVGNEPQGVRHHVPRRRGRPVDLEHDFVGAEGFPEQVDALHHLLRRPTQVGVCSGLWAGRPGVGVALYMRFSCLVVSPRGHGSFVANFAQEVMQGQLPLSVEGIRQPESRTMQDAKIFQSVISPKAAKNPNVGRRVPFFVGQPPDDCGPLPLLV